MLHPRDRNESKQRMSFRKIAASMSGSSRPHTACIRSRARRHARPARDADLYQQACEQKRALTLAYSKRWLAISQGWVPSEQQLPCRRIQQLDARSSPDSPRFGTLEKKCSDTGLPDTGLLRTPDCSAPHWPRHPSCDLSRLRKRRNEKRITHAVILFSFRGRLVATAP